MSWQEGLVSVAVALQGFQFARYIHLAIVVVADVEGDNADGVACNEKCVGLCIVEGKGKDAAQVFQKVDTFVAIQGENHLAVAARLKLIGVSIAFAYFLMIVNFSVDCQHLFHVRAEERLFSRFGVNDRQSFVGKNGSASAIDAAPVWSTVTNFTAHSQCFLSEFSCLLLNVEDRYDSTHIVFFFLLSCIYSITPQQFFRRQKGGDISCRCK